MAQESILMPGRAMAERMAGAEAHEPGRARDHKTLGHRGGARQVPVHAKLLSSDSVGKPCASLIESGILGFSCTSERKQPPTAEIRIFILLEYIGYGFPCRLLSNC